MRPFRWGFVCREDGRSGTKERRWSVSHTLRVRGRVGVGDPAGVSAEHLARGVGAGLEARWRRAEGVRVQGGIVHTVRHRGWGVQPVLLVHGDPGSRRAPDRGRPAGARYGLLGRLPDDGSGNLRAHRRDARMAAGRDPSRGDAGPQPGRRLPDPGPFQGRPDRRSTTPNGSRGEDRQVLPRGTAPHPATGADPDRRGARAGRPYRKRARILSNETRLRPGLRRIEWASRGRGVVGLLGDGPAPAVLAGGGPRHRARRLEARSLAVAGLCDGGPHPGLRPPGSDSRHARGATRSPFRWRPWSGLPST